MTINQVQYCYCQEWVSKCVRTIPSTHYLISTQMYSHVNARINF